MSAILRVMEVVTAFVASLYLIGRVVLPIAKHLRSKWLVVCVLVISPSFSHAACDTTTVQGQIDAAVSGDTVTVTPANCTATWNTLVTIPNTKGITLDLNGATITCGTPCNSNNSPILRLTTNASTASRVTNFTFTTTNGSDGLEVFMEISTTSGHPRFRLDHCTFEGDAMGFHLQVSGPGYGLIDHCTFLWSGNNEVIQHEGYGSGSHTGWLDTITPGSLDALYVEDSTFTNSISGGYQGGKTLSAYGARIVYRFNTLNCMVIDVHGTAGSVGGRWWELYHNTSNAAPNCDNIDKHYQIRAGTGFIFNNTYGTGTNNGAGNIILWEEDSGTYPLLFQVGRGKCSADPCTQGGSSNMALDPAYIWGNENPPMNVGVDEVTASTIVEGRDFYSDDGGNVGIGTISARPSTCTTGTAYWATDEGGNWNSTGGGANDGRLYKCTATNTWTLYYTPATYPHELQGVGGGSSGGKFFLFISEWAALALGVLWHGRTAVLSVATVLYFWGMSVLSLAVSTVRQLSYAAATHSVQTVSQLLSKGPQ